MQTRFTPSQLADPEVARAEAEVRKCVHCGFCLATCPTYVILGDERDSPRGRIYLMKEMLENNRPATADVALHVDRCLSCLSCMTTCPSGVDYRRLVDHARVHIEKTYRRPLADRFNRALLAFVMPRPWAFRLSLFAAAIARPFRGLLPKQLRAMLELAPTRTRSAPAAVGDAPAEAATPGRLKVALLLGCVLRVLDPGINAAAARLLKRLGAEIVDGPAPVCCGSITHHLGKEEAALASARDAIDRWSAMIDRGLERIAITVSGCGATIKDYPSMFLHDPAYAEKARRVAAIARDVTEVVAELGLPSSIASEAKGRRIAYQAACTLQHGQKIVAGPQDLLRQAGFALTPVAEAHLCCGSAGTYNMLQPELARPLRDRKIENLLRGKPEAIATGNIGCMMQIAGGTTTPVVHTVELLDWATGGPKPAALVESEE